MAGPVFAHRLLRPRWKELAAWMVLGQGMAGRRAGRLAAVKASGPALASVHGQGMQFDGVRGYVAGDDVRHIDWKVTARTDATHVKLFREEWQQQVVILLDDGAAMQFGTRRNFKNQQAARIAAYIGGHALAEKERVGAALFRCDAAHHGMEWMPPQTRKTSLLTLLHRAVAAPAVLPVTQPARLEQMLERVIASAPLRATPALLYCISDFSMIDPAAEQGLRQCFQRVRQKHRLVLIAVDDPADREMPERGQYRFRDAAGREARLEAGQGKLQEWYRHFWQHRRDSLLRAARASGVPVLSLGTELTARQLQQQLQPLCASLS